MRIFQHIWQIVQRIWTAKKLSFEMLDKEFNFNWLTGQLSGNGWKYPFHFNEKSNFFSFSRALWTWSFRYPVRPLTWEHNRSSWLELCLAAAGTLACSNLSRDFQQGIFRSFQDLTEKWCSYEPCALSAFLTKSQNYAVCKVQRNIEPRNSQLRTIKRSDQQIPGFLQKNYIQIQ